MYYNRSQLRDKLDELNLIKDKNSDEYFFKYMKIIYSFGRDKILTEYGINKGRELYDKWIRGETLNREDILLLGFLVSDICIIDGDEKKLKDLNTIYYQTITLYKPDFEYMRAFANTTMPQKGYSKLNENYMPHIEQMYLNEHVITDPEQMSMINTGRMSIDNLKICPYCAKEFVEVEHLFKHVKKLHSKK